MAANRNGKVLSIEANHYTKSHPWQSECARLAGMEARQYLHAEVAAILSGSRSRSKITTLVVARVSRNGLSLPARPCPVCQLAIQRAGIKHVEHT